MLETNLYLGVALAGLISFLSPCVLPLVPPYLGYLGGMTIDQVIEEKGLEGPVWRKVVLSSVFFVLGFSTVFIILGASATSLSQWIQSWRQVFGFLSGLIIIIFGIHFLGLLRIPLFYQEARYHLDLSQKGLRASYILGLAFGFGWTPCIGPILATVLVLASQTNTLWDGISLLAVYSLGLGVPFILAAVALRPFLSFMRKFRVHLGKVEKLMGVFLILTGISFMNVFDTLSITSFGQWMLETFPQLSVLEEKVLPQDLISNLRKKSLE